MEVDGFALVWSAGVQYQLTDSTSIGAAYQSQSKIDASGTTTVDTPLGSTSYDTDATITWPQSFGVGVRQQLTSRQVVSLDVIWFNWSAAFDTFDITLVRRRTRLPRRCEKSFRSTGETPFRPGWATNTTSTAVRSFAPATSTTAIRARPIR